jgi:hypothetical protein
VVRGSNPRANLACWLAPTCSTGVLNRPRLKKKKKGGGVLRWRSAGDWHMSRMGKPVAPKKCRLLYLSIDVPAKNCGRRLPVKMTCRFQTIWSFLWSQIQLTLTVRLTLIVQLQSCKQTLHTPGKLSSLESVNVQIRDCNAARLE